MNGIESLRHDVGPVAHFIDVALILDNRRPVQAFSFWYPRYRLTEDRRVSEEHVWQGMSDAVESVFGRWGQGDEEVVSIVGIAPSQSERIDVLERWFEDHIDVRLDRRIGEEVIDLLRTKKVGTVVVAEGIVGCPHEEGIDYPEGEECPECPFWQGKDRWENAVPD